MTDFKDKVQESQEYLKRVAEAIQKRQISTEEAVFASSMQYNKAREMLSKELGSTGCFPNHIGSGFANGEAVASDKSGEVMVRQPLLLPNYSIVKLSYEDLKVHESNKEEFAQKVKGITRFVGDYHEQLFRISDALGGREVSLEEQQEIMEDPSAYLRKVMFRLLDWVDIAPHAAPELTHLTAVDKMALSPLASDKLSLIRESDDRIRDWKWIHNAVENVAVDVMKEKGMDF